MSPEEWKEWRERRNQDRLERDDKRERETLERYNTPITPDHPLYTQIVQRERRVDTIKALMLIAAGLIILLLLVH